MAITLISAPVGSRLAARSPLEYRFISDRDDLQMLLCRVVVDAVPQPVQALYADIHNQFVFDAGRFLRDALWKKAVDNLYGLSLLAHTAGVATAWREAAFSLEVYEVFGAAMPFTDHYAMSMVDLSTATATAVMMSNKGDVNQFEAGTASSRFLTNAPSGIVIGANERENVLIYCPQPVEFLLQRYADNGLPLETLSYAVSGGMSTLPTGPANLEPGILEGCGSYCFWLQNDDGSAASETFTRTLRRQPPAVQTRIHWVNPNHTLDSYTFTGYRSKYSRWQRDADVSGPDIHRTDMIEIATGFENQAVAGWLFEIFSSPAVFMEQEGEFIQLRPVDTTRTEEDLRVKMPVFSAVFQIV